jgi:hypothetical protein
VEVQRGYVKAKQRVFQYFQAQLLEGFNGSDGNVSTGIVNQITRHLQTSAANCWPQLVIHLTVTNNITAVLFS